MGDALLHSNQRVEMLARNGGDTTEPPARSIFRG
jgi:hypothetical protein